MVVEAVTKVKQHAPTWRCLTNEGNLMSCKLRSLGHSMFPDGIIIIHRLYIALFSALKQTHCAHVACGFIARIFLVSTEVVY